MPKHSESKKLPYSADQMFQLVANVAAYPDFLPWTAAARIRSVTNHGDHEVMLADLVVSFKVFRESFGSRVELWSEEKRIETAYIDGPFRHLRSTWKFTDNGEGCDVSFSVDFEFRNKLLQGAAGLFFQEAMQKIVGAFEARAEELYAK